VCANGRSVGAAKVLLDSGANEEQRLRGWAGVGEDEKGVRRLDREDVRWAWDKAESSAAILACGILGRDVLGHWWVCIGRGRS